MTSSEGFGPPELVHVAAIDSALGGRTVTHGLSEKDVLPSASVHLWIGVWAGALETDPARTSKASHCRGRVERPTGIEPVASAWEAEVLPLYEGRVIALG